MKCARTACDNRNAVCRHRQTGLLYCPPCARAINEATEINPPLVSFPKHEGEVKLMKMMDEIFEGWAPEYVLQAVRDQFVMRYHNGGKAFNYAGAAGKTHEALVVFCKGLPGYQEELKKDSTMFNPRW